MSSQHRGVSLLIIDGNCALCSLFSRWVLKKDRLAAWYIAPLGGATHASKDPSLSMDQVLVWDGKLYRGFQAIAHLLRAMGGFWGLVGYVLLLVPKKLGDWIYGLVASWRYKIGGKNSCTPLPDHLRSRLLD